MSPPTVSKVLNGRGGVGEQTRRRVEALLRDHGYRRRRTGGATLCIEAVFNRMLPSIAMDILRGIGEVASSRDCMVGFTDVHRNLLAGQPWVEPLLLRQPAAVITAFPWSPPIMVSSSRPAAYRSSPSTRPVTSSPRPLSGPTTGAVLSPPLGIFSISVIGGSE
ncbi:LacI family DNA-binding transcriptional regulator [Micromonospora sp. M12]